MHYVAACCGMVTLGSCAQEVINEDMTASASQMTIMTRGYDDPITSPVRLYVFDNNNCVAVETLDEGSSAFTKNLPAGSYDIYALAGVDDTRYTLPSKEDATKTAVIALKAGQQLGDLMAGYSSVTLRDGDDNSTTLNLSRKVILIKSITIRDVPEGTTSVSVKISPIQEAMLLNGTYQGDEGEFTTALTKQSDGTTWKMDTENIYLLPSIGKPTITVTVGSTPFAYTCQNELQANHKVTIEGSYKEPTATPAELTLSGTINGVAWGEDSGVSFEFGPSDIPTTPSAEIPAEGSTYLGCYVLKVNGNQVTLLSPSQQQKIIDGNEGHSVILSKINTKLQSWEPTISTNWRLMTKEEVGLIRTTQSSINNLGEASRGAAIGSSYGYFCTDGNTIYELVFTSNNYVEGGRNSTWLRPVTTITIQ